jgi:A/G-specific adenine glycosylase
MLNTNPQIAQFAQRVANWQQSHGRHSLPWQGTRDAYRIWLSEIMLQQTQVDTVIGYYNRFLQRFPTLETLARASLDDVMPYWAGLGYYTRARNLHRCAVELASHWNGRFPPDADQIASLPGIGRSTAAAIAAFAYGQRTPIMDGNVKRVFARYFGIEGQTSASATEKELWALAQAAVEQAPCDLSMAGYTQGLMDLGATCCTRNKPGCEQCPLQQHCYARQAARQHELPARRQRKAIPERSCAVLVLQHGASVLVQKQPSPGIWGGLWSLPRFDDSQMLLQAGSSIAPDAQAMRLAGFQHVFSHFRLNIDPWLLKTTNHIAEPQADQRWLALNQVTDAALPAPIKKLLEGLDTC